MPKTEVQEDPTPRSFKKQVMYSAIAVFIVGLLILLFVSAVTGGIVALLGAIIGMGSRLMDI